MAPPPEPGRHLAAVRGAGRTASAVVALLLLLGAADAGAGPWTKNLGQVYVKLNEGFFLADSYLDASGQVIEGTDYLGLTTSLYFEVGVWRGLQVWGYLPHVVARNSFDDGSRFLQAGGGDALVGLQVTPIQLPFPWAVKLEVKLPMYDVGGIEGSLAPNFPASGDGQVDLTFYLSAGASLGSIPLYAFGEVGYRHRTEAYIGTGDTRSFGDGFAFFAQVGYTFFDRVLVALNSGGIIPFQNDGVTKAYVTLGPALVVPIWRGLAAEASFDPVIHARASSPGYGFGFGLSYKN